MKPLRLSAFAVALVLAACTAAPTEPPLHEPPSLDASDGTSLNGGTTESGGNTLGSGAGAQTDTTGRGGNGIGSGN